MEGLLHANLGISYRTHRPVLDDLIDYFPATLELTTVAMILAFAIGIVSGTYSAQRRNQKADHLLRVLSLGGVSMPAFFAGILLQLLFGMFLGLLPISGRVDPIISQTSPIREITGIYLIDTLVTGNLPAFQSSLTHIILPALALSFGPIATISRMTRSSMLEVLGQDYIRTAKSKGLPQRLVIYKHALKNAMIPVLTIAGLVYGLFLGGSILVEAIFDWPGVGLYAIGASMSIDYNAILGAALLFTTIYCLVNLIVDLLYAVVDPRVRYD